MRFIELFAGIGGFRYGLEACNNRRSLQGQGAETVHGRIPNTPAQLREYECVYSNEWDKYAASIYRRHYGKIDQRDITTVDVSEIPEHNLLTGGFPCQAFSVAGKRLGFEDTRGTLFFEIARILKHHRPGHLLLENVKGLLSHDEGQTFSTILGVLTDLGYRTEWMVLNSKHFGVPQNRERVFIIGHLRGECRGQVFPVGENSQPHSGTGKLYDRQQLLEGQQPGELQEKKEEATNYRIRRLTPVECERLQGFPDGWTAEGDDVEISDTQRYKACGNAVTTSVITAIGQSLQEHIITNGGA